MWVSHTAYPQLFIPNGDFEDYHKCPDGLTQIERTKNWFSAGIGTPDYFLNCGLKAKIQPSSGEGMAAIIPHSSYKVDQEFLGVKLLDSLHKGKMYCLIYYVQPDAESPELIDALGIKFSRSRPMIRHWQIDTINPDLRDKQFHLPGIWTKVIFKYLAKGGEQFLAIGNFNVPSKTNTEVNAPKKSAAWYSYYYFDGFKLFESVDGQCEVESAISSDMPFTTKDELTLNLYFDSDQYMLNEGHIFQLQSFLTQLKRINAQQLKIVGHTDSDASNLYNMILSKNRMESVSSFVTSKADFQLVQLWKGEEEPMSKNTTEKGKAENRRVTISLIK